MAAAGVARTAARQTRAKAAVKAGSAPRGKAGAVRARGSQKAARLEQAANVSTIAGKRVRVRTDTGKAGAQKPTITALTVILGANFLHAWIVDKKPLPSRDLFVKLAIMGFVLSLLAEVSPKLGKGLSYLIMTAVLFDRSQGILEGLQDKPKEREPGKAGPSPLPFPPETRPATLYSRGGTSTVNDPQLAPTRPARLKRPNAGALYNI